MSQCAVMLTIEASPVDGGILKVRRLDETSMAPQDLNFSLPLGYISLNLFWWLILLNNFI